MLELDGSAGGGQLLRTALTLSVVDGQSFRMTNVRGNRSTPGLRPQHLAAVRLAAALSQASVDGASPESTTLTFRPNEVVGGTFDADIGTAGSITLLLDTVLPVAGRLDDPVTVRATGGTDVRWSPPLDYLRRVKLPLLDGVGLDSTLTLTRRGFYPAGGGEVTLELAPSSPTPLDFVERGELGSVSIYSTASESLRGQRVAERQAERAETLCAETTDAESPPITSTATYHDTSSAGSALVVAADYDRTLVGFDGLGERGVSSETVAERVVSRFESWRAGPGAVDPHMGDQLLVLLALVGGTVWIPRVTDHVETNLSLIRAFGYDVALDDHDDGGAIASRAVH
ncbi:MAG: RNA 3'-terminal phosphate cyclase [Halobacteriota archaeon]